ncbi:hypothetical protein E2C01_024513 [Portunus trituberculatus]|uniref:Uncharacterized protein n=1 Tax=Portunus trituberculatus TaxID=210409 RepID=A0A5B7ED16_PORTR|nr:hypothetical protein [Portunus trituberculatus]
MQDPSFSVETRAKAGQDSLLRHIYLRSDIRTVVHFSQLRISASHIHYTIQIPHWHNTYFS